jgi:4-diphosphocytidyl-2-C-methyl-D-erythritol kinase
MGGGLGGGSSDAATTLMALNHLWKLDLTSQQLQEIGLELGADVPVFIFGKNAWGEGVGEQLTSIELPDSCYLVIHPQIFVSTAQIFTSKDLTRDCHPLTIRAFQQGTGSNVCEPVAAKLYPEIGQALDWLNRFSPARMTGTGACIFAAFTNAEEAEAVRQQLPDRWIGYVVNSLQRNPVASALLGQG